MFRLSARPPLMRDHVGIDELLDSQRSAQELLGRRALTGTVGTGEDDDAR